MSRRSEAMRKTAAFVAIGFGVLTVFAGGRALFGSDAARAVFGDAVPFVLWFNFLAGGFYIVAGIGVLWRRKWALWLSVGILVGTALTFMALGGHVLRGGAFEMRTVAAMSFRTAIWGWIVFVVAAYRVGHPATKTPPHP